MKNKGYEQIVYTDNNLGNCQNFLRAGRSTSGIVTRCYYLLNTKPSITLKQANFWAVGSLYGIIKNEKRIVSS